MPQTHTQQILERFEKIYIFVAYNDGVVFHSKMFDDHTEMKIWSAKHSSFYRDKDVKYSSTYFKLTDTDFLSTLENAVREQEESKNNAYRERDMLVCALSKIFPSYLARHDDSDTEWENDWRWIVYINIPTKVKVVSGDQHNHTPEDKWFETKTEQVSWHIHDSEREMFNHLEVKENNWDGHNTERKYKRLQSLSTLSSK